MTQPVRRYSVDCYGEAFDYEQGEYVLATDYLALEADLLRANSNNTALYSSLERVIAERDAAIAERNRARADEELADSRWMQDGEKREKAEAERDALRAVLLEIVNRPNVNGDHTAVIIQGAWITNVAKAALATQEAG